MTTMSVSTFIATAPRLPASTSILLRGAHGIGKSQLGRQLAALIASNEGIQDFEVIDRRLSQVSEGDIIGLPSTDGEVTRFNPPDWYKRACTKPCFLFLDELNRATPEVMQAAFQIVLDRELNGWKLHPQTRVMSAINSSAEYNVNEVDPALLDRFWAVDLEPTAADWLNWARLENPNKGGKRNIIGLVTDFIAQEDRWLDPPKQHEPGAITVSRRSWERLSDTMRHAGLDEKPEDPAFYSLSIGYVGTEASIRFVEFAKSIDNRFTGEDIVERYNKKEVQKKVKGRDSADVLNDAIEKVAEHTKAFKEFNKHQQANVKKFCQDLPAELRIILWTKLVAEGTKRIDFIKSVRDAIAEVIVTETFGVPMGEKGIGVMPNIPSSLQNINKK